MMEKPYINYQIDFESGSWSGFVLPKMASVKYITVHNTAEPFSGVQERMRVQNRIDGLHTCFHFAVDEKGAFLIVPLDRVSYHAGDGVNGPGNTSSVSVEICRSACYGDNAGLYYRSEANAMRLCAYLMREYGISIDRVRKHQDWSGKFCPHRMLFENRWRGFVEDLKKFDSLGNVDVAIGAIDSVPVIEEEPIVAMCHDGKMRWIDFRGHAFDSDSAMMCHLKQTHVDTVLVSAWHDVRHARTCLNLFRRNQIKVKGYYAVPNNGGAYWARENILQEHVTFERYLNKGGCSCVRR